MWHGEGQALALREKEAFFHRDVERYMKHPQLSPNTHRRNEGSQLMTHKKKSSVETAVLAERATQPVREYPEEAYCFSAEELDQAPDSGQVKAPSPAKRTRTEEPRIRVRKPDYTLKDLLAQITEENRHEVVDFGPPVGKEVW